MTCTGRETLIDLIILDLVDLDVNMGKDWLAFYHAILDCYA